MHRLGIGSYFPLLTPICDEMDYRLIRADRIAEAGMITTQVVEHLINDELVVADLNRRPDAEL